MLDGVVRVEQLGADDGRPRMALRVPDERPEPAGARDRVVVEEDEIVAGRGRRAGVAGAGEPLARGMGDHADPFAVGGQQARRQVDRAVVDDDDLAVEAVVLLTEQDVQALPRQRRLVVDGDNDRAGRSRPRRRRCHLARALYRGDPVRRRLRGRFDHPRRSCHSAGPTVPVGRPTVVLARGLLVRHSLAPTCIPRRHRPEGIRVGRRIPRPRSPHTRFLDRPGVTGKMDDNGDASVISADRCTHGTLCLSHLPVDEVRATARRRSRRPARRRCGPCRSSASSWRRHPRIGRAGPARRATNRGRPPAERFRPRSPGCTRRSKSTRSARRSAGGRRGRTRAAPRSTR